MANEASRWSVFVCRGGLKGLRSLPWMGLLALSAVAEAQNPCGGSTPYATLKFGNQTQTICGSLENIDCDAGNQTPAFLGIQYATAGRWQPPSLYVPAGSPPPAYQATSYGAICAQDMTNKCTTRSQCGGTPQPIPVSENCLFLNVWTPPGASGSTHYPVMVWIHGGAFFEGSSSSPDPSCNGNIFDGGYLAKENNMVVVSLNYRLGALGFLASQDTTLAAGNYGLMDQQLAIQWVIEHIAAFGGDPNKIVLVGESAGAHSVGLHLTGATNLPNIKGGIMESAPLGIPLKQRSDAQTYYFANFLKYFQDQSNNNKWACTQIKPPYKAICASGDSAAACYGKVQSQAQTSDVLAAQACTGVQLATWLTANKYNAGAFLGKALELALPWSPIVDGDVFNLANWTSGPIPTQSLNGQPITLASSVTKPILLGTNKNEGLLFIDLGHAPVSSEDDYKNLLKGIFGLQLLAPSPVWKSVLRHYPSTGSVSHPNYTDPEIQVLADYAFTCANQYFAQQVAANQPVWAYQFNETSAFYPGQGASLECCSSLNCPSSYCPSGGCDATNAYCCLGTTCHAAELPYVFANTSLFSGWTSPQKSMADDIATYWGNFIENPTGGPASSGPLPSWPKFTGTNTSNYLLMNTAQSGYFATGDVVKSMTDAPAIDCSLFERCYSNSEFPFCSADWNLRLSRPTP